MNINMFLEDIITHDIMEKVKEDIEIDYSLNVLQVDNIYIAYKECSKISFINYILDISNRHIVEYNKLAYARDIRYINLDLISDRIKIEEHMLEKSHVFKESVFSKIFITVYSSYYRNLLVNSIADIDIDIDLENLFKIYKLGKMPCGIKKVDGVQKLLVY
jgi:hypothetical protein